MERQRKLIGGIILGAGAMYLLDPDRGARRRSLLRDQIVHAGHKVGEGASATARDTKNRAKGAAAELRSRLREDEADDEIVHERVRAAIGRVVSHPGAIDVRVFDGRATLSGHVLADELDELIRRVGRVRGVREVRNELQIHRVAGGVSALQGDGQSIQPRQNWAPAMRLLAATTGGWMALKGIRRRGRVGRTLASAGFGLAARALTSRPAKSPAGSTGSQNTIDIQKTMSLGAPIEDVWELWSNFEHFPRFMSHLREVRRLSENRSHWVAAGPAGVPVEWDAMVTEWLPMEVIGWKSVEGSAVQTAGRVRFRSLPDRRTEIDIHMWYRPPGGTIGHAVASLFGTDAKQAMDNDLMRLKSLLEEGKTRAEGEPVHLDDVISGSRSP